MATTTFERADGVTADVTVRFSSLIFYRWTTTPTSATVGPSIDITDDAQAAYLKTVNLLKVTGETGVYVPPARPKRVFWDDTDLIGVDDAGSGSTLPFVKTADLDNPSSAALQKLSVRSEGPLSPTRYGADPTGTSDSTAAIQAAWNAIGTAGGGDCIIDGNYRIDSPLVPRDNLRVFSQGWGSRACLKPSSSWNGGADGSIIQKGGSVADPTDNFACEGVAFDLSAVPSTVQCKALFVTYMRNLRFLDNYIYRSTATGIGADFLDGGLISRNRVVECGRYAEGNEATRLGCSGIGIGTGEWGSEATVVSENWVIDPVRYGIFMERQGGISDFFTRGLQIINNYISGAYWGIGSNGVAWMHVIGNHIEGSTQDGISVHPGNAGGNSWGDLIALNTVTGSGRYGIGIDQSSAGNGSPTDAGKFMVSQNRILDSVGVGLKIISGSALAGLQILQNRISGGGSIGLDIAGGGIRESDILGNRIVDNTGIGIRALSAITGVRISGNRSGDTRSSGRTQTHGLVFGSGATHTDVLVDGNDFRNNVTAAYSASGATLNNVRILPGNLGIGPDVVDALSVGASPYTYTVGERREQLWVIGGTFSSIKVNGQTVLASPGTLIVEPGDAVEFTYSSAPTAIKRRKL